MLTCYLEILLLRLVFIIYLFIKYIIILVFLEEILLILLLVFGGTTSGCINTILVILYSNKEGCY